MGKQLTSKIDESQPEAILLHLVQDGCGPSSRILAHTKSLQLSIDRVRRESFKVGLLAAAKMCRSRVGQYFKEGRAERAYGAANCAEDLEVLTGGNKQSVKKFDRLIAEQEHQKRETR